MKNLTRKSALAPRTTPSHPIALLKVFGLDYSRPANRHLQPFPGSESFWLREQHQLAEILFDVRQSYKLLMLRHHPDKPGGDNKTCAYINSCYTKTKKLFAKKGATLC